MRGEGASATEERRSVTRERWPTWRDEAWRESVGQSIEGALANVEGAWQGSISY